MNSENREGTSPHKKRRLGPRTNLKIKENRAHIKNRAERREIDTLLNRVNERKNVTLLQNGDLTLQTKRDVVDGYRKLVGKLNVTHFLTFMPGRSTIHPERIAANVIKFCCRAERRALGRNWSKYEDDRIRMVAFLEKPDLTPHYHGLAWIPKSTAQILEASGGEIWAKLMPIGKFEITEIRSERQVTSYLTKDLHHHWSPENTVIYAPIR